MKNSNNKIIILLIISIFLLCFFQSVVYSAFESTYDVTGDAYVRLATDVRITDFKISEKYISSNYVSNYEKFSRNSVSPSITFNGSGTVYYDVEITNYNDNKVGIYSVNGLPDGVTCSFKDYTLGNVLVDGIGTTTFTICFSGSGSYDFDFIIDIRSVYSITYDGFEGSGYPTNIFEDEEVVIDFGDETVSNILMTVDGSEYTNFTLENNTLTFGPVDGDVVITKKANILEIVSGDLNTVGSEVSIIDEHFYVISSDEDSVTMLAKYNLYVGGYSDGGSWDGYGTAATGKQDSKMLGYVVDQETREGVLGFSDYGTEYSRSNAETYVNNYVSYLESEGAIISEGRVMTITDLNILGCKSSKSTCSSAPKWVYSTSYWTSTPGSDAPEEIVYAVDTSGSITVDSFFGDVSFGIRPVIIVSK